MNKTHSPRVAGVWIQQLLADLRFSLRSLKHARGYALAVVLTLTLGIGVAAVILDLASWILFRSTPYPQADQLYVIGFKNKEGAFKQYRYGFDLQSFKEQANAFTEYAAVSREVANTVVDGQTGFANLRRISADTFHCFGVAPALGRGFLPEEYRAGANQVVVISDGFWRRSFNADPTVVGRDLQLGDQLCRIIGVLRKEQPLPPYFVGEVYQPLVVTTDPASPFTPILFIIGRLKSEVSLRQAGAELAKVKVTLSPTAADYVAGDTPEVSSLKFAAYQREIYWIMSASAIFLYVVACLNATNLFLVRVLGRRREVSVRLALGGSGMQIARLLLMESTLLSLSAGLLAVVGGYFVFPSIMAQLAGDMVEAYSWSPSVLQIAVVLSAIASLVMAVIPVVQTWRPKIQDGLKGSSGNVMGDTGKMKWSKDALVILQAALAIVLLTGTGLMIRTFQRLQNVDLGVNPAGKLKVQVSLPAGYKLSSDARYLLFQQLEERLQKLVGVRGVTFGSDAVLAGAYVGVNRVRMPQGNNVAVQSDLVTSNFDQVAGLRLKAGRWVGDKRWPLEAVINESFAKVRFGNENPVGQEIKMGSDLAADTPLLVVGVVQDVRETVRAAAGFHVYLAARLYPPGLSTFILSTSGENPALPELVRRTIRDFDQRLIATAIEPLDQVVKTSLNAERRTLIVLRAISVVALLLAALGMYSVMTYTVDRQMNEFGVRLALGGTPAGLVRLVMKRGLLLVGAGVLLGFATNFALTRFLRTLLYETTPYDPFVYLGVAGLLIGIATLSCWLPARRAGGASITGLLRST